ncbi:MAG: PepSY-associated TM helix domain-containing protein [Pseudomonadota bacterium]|nr:PepSY-associated TM helix domain-containing protein [Pseudomonadota bacterium]
MKRPLRTALFWLHLTGGVAAGLAILSLAVSGALLGFERQLLAAASTLPPKQGSRIPLEQGLPKLVQAHAQAETLRITLARDGVQPARVQEGRGPATFVDTRLGMAIEDPAPRLRAALASLRAYHRWLTLSGVQRDQARGLLGAANLVFLGLILTGAVLWWPRILRWPWLRQQLTWRPAPPTAKARDLRLHHIIGAWAFLPLLIICASGTVFYYRWANDAVYSLAGETAPVRAPAPDPSGHALTPGSVAERFSALPLEALIESAVPGWTQLTVTLGGEASEPLRFSVDKSAGGQPQAVTTVTVFEDGRVETASFATLSDGQRARRLLRFLHTGEALGIGGQVIATGASIGAAIMVWSGLALSTRRLILTPWRRRRQDVRQGR